ncbi:unnamed protein product [Rotaria magnacalcarata]|uniref:Ig-like domain-containing protein n=3 Tax=Rotaria magnacalcarata TaxID=392030 RepID=A0A816SIZ8_9BILA|nr:unnamed protein product [Rotaria magnacalcarata]CAF1619611.1 unnamed protein product [Rotaria magnacalcarata]CAF2079769.1 unnamed protein product [Rotaria magnacalcarata]CAF2085555.1 unnamed protein product [Rotaria magnacalcarata]CAF3883469.1 unnamed protein product [Rotaria magnacalcarata]
MMMFQLKQLVLFILIVLMIELTIAVKNFPQILTKAYNQTLNVSSTAILTCHIRDLGEHHVTWFKHDSSTFLSYPLTVGKELFTTDKRYSISSYSTSMRESYWSLEIYQLHLSDEGTYLCQITNRRATTSVPIFLHIQIPMILSPSNLYVEPGTNVKLNCSILIDNENNQSLLLPINWFFLSNQFNKTKPDDIHVRKRLINNSLNSYLIIHHAQTYHSGIWICVYRRQRRTAKLIVEKDVLQRQRISALLSNNSQRHSSLSNCLLFIMCIVYYRLLFV